MVETAQEQRLSSRNILEDEVMEWARGLVVSVAWDLVFIMTSPP